MRGVWWLGCKGGSRERESETEQETVRALLCTYRQEVTEKRRGGGGGRGAGRCGHGRPHPGYTSDKKPPQQQQQTQIMRPRALLHEACTRTHTRTWRG